MKEGQENKKTDNNNSAIVDIFYEIADILEMQNVKWKPQAYRIAAQTLESLREDVSNIYRKEGEKGLEELPGIGEGLAEKIIQFLKKGKIQEYEKLKKTLPHGLYEMMKIPGVGAKHASLFYHKLEIKNINELKKAAESKKLIGLPGFKEKAEENILGGIAILKGQKERMPLKEAEKIVNKVLPQIKSIKEIDKVIIAGSFRRKKEIIGDLDIVILTKQPELVLKKIVKMDFVKEVLGVGSEKATIISSDNIQIDFRVFTSEEFGAGLLYFTGDKQHNIWLRKIAIKKGLKLNEYGLFEKRTGKRIAGATEKEVYDKLRLRFINPEERIGEVK